MGARAQLQEVASGQPHDPAALVPEDEPLQGLRGPQSRSGRGAEGKSCTLLYRLSC
jgi:hypothetical protein